MAPEQAILKRKRSRPSEWWAVAPNSNATDTPQQQNKPSPKKRGRSSNFGTKRIVQEAPAAANRGKTRKSMTQEDVENAEDGRTDVAKPPRRGRPSKAEAEAEAEVLATAKLAAEIEGANKKKRGQTAQRRSEGDGTIAEPARRGRSSNTEAELEAATKTGNENLNGASKKKQKRAKTANAETEAPADAVAAATVVVNKKRTRQSGAEIVEPIAATSSTQEEAPLKRRKRQKGAQIDEPAAAESLATDLDGRTARGRRSGIVVEVETATSSLARDRNVPKNRDNLPKAANDKAKPSKSKRRNQQSNLEIQENKELQPQGKKPKRPNNADAQRHGKEVAEMIETPPEPERRQVERESENAPASQRENQPMYQHLAPVTHRVSRQTIETKWEPLTPACIERISQIVHDLQRPVIVHINDDRKRTEANTALHMVSRRLISKVSKGLPFPPSMRNSREDDFDFEKILDYNSALEAQLTPALHAIELLEAELAKETGQLESDQATLATLEANAKTEATVRKEAGRKLHPLLQSDSAITEVDLNDQLGLEDVLQSVLPFSHTENEDLQDIAKELNGHLDTIHSNIDRVQGISEAITQSRAAVQATLFDRLDTNDYEDIVLG